jgi:CheY-like chemotaxis protein
MDPGACVLVAEDNPDDALLMQRAFKSQGLDNPLHIVTDGTEVLKYLLGQDPFADRAAHPHPNVLVLDLKMPRMNGFEVLEWLQAHKDLSVIPTLVWSSSADARDVKRAYCLGANGYLVKPTDFQKFKQMVGDVMRYWEHCLKPAPEARPSCAELTSKMPQV